ILIRNCLDDYFQTLQTWEGNINPSGIQDWNRIGDAIKMAVLEGAWQSDVILMFGCLPCVRTCIKKK
ncbi:hypothetical protein Bpfe_012960, partial [Biomphalaria pfeifferi]